MVKIALNRRFKNMSNQVNRLFFFKVIQCLHTDIKDGAPCISAVRTSVVSLSPGCSFNQRP